MSRQDLQEKTVQLARDVKCSFFLIGFGFFFFSSATIGKPRQPDLSASNFLVPEGRNCKELNIMFQLEFGLKIL